MFIKAIGVLALANAALAICPGFNFGIGNVQSLGNGVNRCEPTYTQAAYLIKVIVDSDSRESL